MWIVCQSKKSVANMDNVLGLAVRDNLITAKLSDNTKFIVLGEYKSDERATEVFEGMLEEVFPKEVIVFENVSVTDDVEDMLKRNGTDGLIVQTDSDEIRIDRIEPRVYYMPQE